MTEIIVNGFVSLGAAFLGAWFAYRFNLKQQKKWDKERNEEEKREQQLSQLSHLNYLQTYLHSYVDDFYSIYQKLKYRKHLYKRIIKKNYNLDKLETQELFTVFVDFSYQFSINKKDFLFTINEPPFLYVLAKVETLIQRFNRAHVFGNEMLLKEKEMLYRDLQQYPNFSKWIVSEFINKHLHNLNEQIYLLQKTVACIDKMLEVFYDYTKEYHFYNLADLSYSNAVKPLVNSSKKIMKKYKETFMPEIETKTIYNIKKK